jgi:hypothetical protein
MKNILGFLLLLLTPAFSHAFSMTYIDPKYSHTCWLTPSMETISIAFDQNGNYYTEPIGDDGEGFVEVYRNETEALATYSTTAFRVTGLATDYGDRLIISETNAGGCSGQLTLYDLPTETKEDHLSLDDFRATGIAYNPASNSVLFTAKRTGDHSFDGIYEVDLNDFSAAHPVVPGFQGTGIAFDQAGNYYVSTSASGSPGFLGNSVYRLDSSFGNSLLIATFDSRPDELNVDASGMLYVVGDPTRGTGGNEIFQISLVPIPDAFWLLGSGLIGLVGIRRRAHK